MPVILQKLAGAEAADQFDGLTSSTGLFSFAFLNRIPRTSRVRLLTLWYHAEAGANVADYIEFRFVQPGQTDLERGMIGTSEPENNKNPDDTADVRHCGIDVPRNPGDNGEHWDIVVKTTGKDADALVGLDWVIVEYPDTDARDSLR